MAKAVSNHLARTGRSGHTGDSAPGGDCLKRLHRHLTKCHEDTLPVNGRQQTTKLCIGFYYYHYWAWIPDL